MLSTPSLFYKAMLLCLAIFAVGGAQASSVNSAASVDGTLQVVRVAAAKPEFAVAQDYFVQLLRKALVAGANGRPVPIIHETQLMEQNLGVQEMIRGKKVDIYWMGTDQERQSKLRAIRIPLERGLIGQRRFIIHRNMKGAFDEVTNVRMLRNYFACQGVDWPDTRVLRSAGLKVREIANVERIFSEVNNFHCEYFPRGYFEGYSEIAQRKESHPDLLFYEGLVLSYPFALYFFVNLKDDALARWVETGLERMIDNGQFLAHMETHPLTSAVFPLNKIKSLRWISIEHPDLPAGLDYTNARYWFQPEDFQ